METKVVDLNQQERRTLLRLLDKAWAATNGLREKSPPSSGAEAEFLEHQQHLEAIMAKLR